jgi:hypothetical protein
MALYLSWPAVSHICALTVFPSIYTGANKSTTKESYVSTLTSMLLVANSTPIVDFDSEQNSFLVKRESKLDFPTPESPIRTTLNR